MKTLTIRGAALVLALLIGALMLTACGGNAADGYSVTVKDALGHPYTSGIVVRFMQDGTQVAMQPVDENGVATKKLDSGEYTIELSFTDSEAVYHYDTDVTVSDKTPSVDVIMAKTVSGTPEVLYVESNEYDAYALETGCTYVELEAGTRRYFLFAPTTAGTYEFSVPSSADVQISYHGAPHFVQQNNLAEMVDGKFTVSVSAGMIGTDGSGTTVYVLAVETDNADVTDAVIAIDRIGDPQKTIEDEPWTIYQKTVELTPYTLPQGAKLAEFDLEASTDTYKLVFNDADGFYHLNKADGPLVLVRLAEDSDYIASFATMLDRSGVSKYFYDENDEFVKRESYSECLLEYIEYVDEVEGVYPLTKDLEYIIKQRGDYAGWWDIDGTGYIFKDLNGNNDPAINAELAWLLMCCYVE